jgi:hypothetical protein
VALVVVINGAVGVQELVGDVGQDGKEAAATAVGVMATARAFCGAGFGRLVVWLFILCSSIGEIGGIHPHGDGKSPEAIESNGVAGVHCAARVRKKQKGKKIDVGRGHFVTGNW